MAATTSSMLTGAPSARILEENSMIADDEQQRGAEPEHLVAATRVASSMP